MRVKLYKGYQKGIDDTTEEYYEIFNSDYDASKEIDQLGNPLVFQKNMLFSGEIVSWTPFCAELDNGIRKIFVCENCGCNSCVRPNHNKFADPHFYQGNYLCANCGAESTYYSNSFKSRQLLTLF